MSDDYYDPELEAEQAAAAEQLNELLVTRQQLQSQTQALQGDVGSFRREQQLAWDAAHTASVELAAAQGGDFYAPDVGQQVAPDGTVTYDFDAHLHARGVDIDVGLTSTPPNDRRIRWLRADGGVVAQLFAYQDAQFVEGNLITTPDNGARLSQISGLYIGATDVISARALVTNPAKAPATQTRTIIDDTGASNFAQVLGAPIKRMIEGPFSSSYSLPAGSSARLGPFTLSQPYSSTAVAIGGLFGTQAQITRVGTWSQDWVSASQFFIDVYNAHPTVATVGSWGGFVIHD
jgi:hypothetical protein